MHYQTGFCICSGDIISFACIWFESKVDTVSLAKHKVDWFPAGWLLKRVRLTAKTCDHYLIGVQWARVAYTVVVLCIFIATWHATTTQASCSVSREHDIVVLQSTRSTSSLISPSLPTLAPSLMVTNTCTQSLWSYPKSSSIVWGDYDQVSVWVGMLGCAILFVDKQWATYSVACSCLLCWFCCARLSF